MNLLRFLDWHWLRVIVPKINNKPTTVNSFSGVSMVARISVHDWKNLCADHLLCIKSEKLLFLGHFTCIIIVRIFHISNRNFLISKANENDYVSKFSLVRWYRLITAIRRSEQKKTVIKSLPNWVPVQNKINFSHPYIFFIHLSCKYESSTYPPQFYILIHPLNCWIFEDLFMFVGKYSLIRRLTDLFSHLYGFIYISYVYVGFTNWKMFNIRTDVWIGSQKYMDTWAFVKYFMKYVFSL